MFWFLFEKRAVPLPSPFKNQGYCIISLSQLVRWLGAMAEELGFDVYQGFAAGEVLLREQSLQQIQVWRKCLRHCCSRIVMSRTVDLEIVHCGRQSLAIWTIHVCSFHKTVAF